MVEAVKNLHQAGQGLGSTEPGDSFLFTAHAAVIMTVNSP